MRRARKLRRKQPRRLTPPLSLRDSDGWREIVALDEELTTDRQCQSGRVMLFLNLAAGLHLQVGSRCVNKRRVMSLTIRPVGEQPQPHTPSAYCDALHEMQADAREYLKAAGIQNPTAEQLRKQIEAEHGPDIAKEVR